MAFGGWPIGGAGEHFGFEGRNAVHAPGGVDQFLDELAFGGRFGLVFVEEFLGVALVCGRVFGGQKGRLPVRPWVKALREERSLPEGVRGPVECWELARFVAARSVQIGTGKSGIELILSIPG
jgi:hypothetical protein